MIILKVFSVLVMGCASYFTNLVFSAMILNSHESITHGLLYPRESETREVKSLDGMWNFLKSDTNNPTQGIREKWFNNSLSKIKSTIQMPVPSSYNDVTTDNELRDHVGTVWYDRTFFVPLSWELDRKTWIRFGSVSYEAVVVSVLFFFADSNNKYLYYLSGLILSLLSNMNLDIYHLKHTFQNI